MENVLRKIEMEASKDPHYVWNFLAENDLLVTKSGGRLFIIGVREYIPVRRMIAIKFIYDLQSDKFFRSSGLEYPDLVERGPTLWEAAQLNVNLDYQIFKE